MLVKQDRAVWLLNQFKSTRRDAYSLSLLQNHFEKSIGPRYLGYFS